MKPKVSFENFLIENQILSGEVIRAISLQAKKSNISVMQALQEKGLLSPENLAQVLSKYHECPYLAPPLKVSRESVSKVPIFTLRRYKIIPLQDDGKKVVVAVTDPSNVLASDEIRRVTGLKVEIACASEEAILEAINRIHHDEKVEGEAEAGESNPAAIDQQPSEVAERLLEGGIKRGASDLHFEPKRDFTLIRERIDGILYEVERLKMDQFVPLVSRLKFLAGMDIVEKRLSQDGRFKFETSEIRASTLPTLYGEKLVLRILRSQVSQPSLEMLGLDPDRMAQLRRICDASEGLILVAGPTGSGKSTTLYSILGTLDNKSLNLITVEDPVEFELELANQVQINSKIGNTFASLLPVILRQDPDVILIGELRDEKTAQMCMRAAMSGHLVFSTLHAPSSLSCVTRLSDMEVAPHMIVASLRAALSQRLLRKLCQDCKTSYEAREDERKILGVPVDSKLTLFSPKGCDKCHQIGYRSRFAVIEVLEISDALRESILTRDRRALASAAKAAGFVSLWDDGVRRVLSGQTSLKELVAQCG